MLFMIETKTFITLFPLGEFVIENRLRQWNVTFSFPCYFRNYCILWLRTATRGGNRAIFPPKFSQTRLVVRYNNKLQSLWPPTPENISWLRPCCGFCVRDTKQENREPATTCFEYVYAETCLEIVTLRFKWKGYKPQHPKNLLTV